MKSIMRLPDWTKGRACVHGPLTAAWGGKLVEFTYKTNDVDYPLEVRQVRVDFVFAYNGRTYLHGYCRKHGDIRSYRMDATSMHLGRGETCAIREVVTQQPALF
jgi:hypothetical protein